MGKVKQINIDEDFETILICAERYALGRMSYMPHLVIGYITPLLPSLSIRALAVLERDVSSADGYGDEKIDRPDWMKFLTAVSAELARKRAKL